MESTSRASYATSLQMIGLILIAGFTSIFVNFNNELNNSTSFFVMVSCLIVMFIAGCVLILTLNLWEKNRLQLDGNYKIMNKLAFFACMLYVCTLFIYLLMLFEYDLKFFRYHLDKFVNYICKENSIFLFN